MTGPTYRPAAGLLLAAIERGELAPVSWAPVDLGGGLIITVATDALRATLPDAERPLRLPVSYQDTITICRSMGCITPTAAMSDAIWRAASIKVPPHGLVNGSADERSMATVEWTLRHNAAIEAHIGGSVPDGAIVADVGKDWILDDGLSVRGAVNYGWRTVPSGHPVQPIGHFHFAGHADYSQVCRPVKRWASLHGDAVDLLEWLAPTVQDRWLAAFR